MNSKRVFIHPNLTTPHYSTRIYKGLLLYLNKTIGDDESRKIVEKTGITWEYLTNEHNWVSEVFAERFYETLTSDKRISKSFSYEAAKLAAEDQHVGAILILITKFLTPSYTFKNLISISKRYNKTDKVEVISVASNSARFKFVSNRKTNFLPQIMDSWAGFLQEIPAKFKIPPAEWKTIVVDSHRSFEIELKWSSDLSMSIERNAKVLLEVLLSILICLISFKALANERTLLTSSASVAAIVIQMLRFIFLMRKNIRAKSETEHVTVLLNEIEKKYEELQLSKSLLDRRYREANLLSKVIQTISRFMEKKEIIHSAITEIHQRLGYDRVLVLENNEQRKMLVATQSVGFGEQAASVLERYQVPIEDQTAEEFHIGNVFRKKIFTKINVTESYIQTLSEEGRRIVKTSGASSFVMGAIATERKTYGVMLVDYLSEGQLMTDDDVHIIRNVCAQIAISLENAESLFQETLARKTFQKYVPKEIVDRLLSNSENSFESVVNKDITVLFYDLRNFTYRSTQSDHQSLRDILNIYHETLSNVVYKHGGIVDKFLGDGFFAIFNAFEDSEDHTVRACAAAYEMKVRMGDISNWIRKNAKNPNIWLDCEIGIGINCGTAGLCYLGTSDKQEYTAIGTTVNAASRLAELSKKHGDRTIVSKEVVERASKKFEFSFAERTTIRGLTEEWEIFILDKPKSLQNESDEAA